jgi:hypothetical protein
MCSLLHPQSLAINVVLNMQLRYTIPQVADVFGHDRTSCIDLASGWTGWVRRVLDRADRISFRFARALMENSRKDRIREGMKKVWKDPEYRARLRKKISEGMYSMHRIRMSETTKKKPEYRAKQSQSTGRLWDDPEYRARQSEDMKKVWKDPEYRAKVKKHWENPEHRAKVSEVRKRLWEKPEYRAKVSEAKANPKYRAKLSEAKKKHWENPEHRTKQSAGRRGRWNKLPGADAEICPLHPSDKSVPAFVYVLPMRIKRSNRSRKSQEMNKMLREMPRGIFCYDCFQQRRDIIEQATELLGLCNLTEEIKKYVKDKTPRTRA